jgi:hypothetical protein
VVKVVGLGMCIYNSIGRRYPILCRLSPAYAWASEENGRIEAGGDLEYWRADHRVLVQQRPAAESATNDLEAPTIRRNCCRARQREGRLQPRVSGSRFSKESGARRFRHAAGFFITSCVVAKPRRFQCV